MTMPDEPSCHESTAGTTDYYCPECFGPVSVDRALAGTVTDCPRCHQQTLVPPPSFWFVASGVIMLVRAVSSMIENSLSHCFSSIGATYGYELSAYYLYRLDYLMHLTDFPLFLKTKDSRRNNLNDIYPFGVTV